MQHSPRDQHTHDMLDFFLNLIVGPELAPQVRVPSSLPVLYIIDILTVISLLTDPLSGGRLVLSHFCCLGLVQENN